MSPGQNCAGDEVAERGLVGEERLHRGQAQREGRAHCRAGAPGLAEAEFGWVWHATVCLAASTQAADQRSGSSSCGSDRF